MFYQGSAPYASGMETKVFARRTARPWGVFVVEDDEHARAFFEASIRRSDSLLWLAGVGSVREAMAWLASTSQPPDVLLTDLGLPDGNGLDVIRSTVARFPNCEPLVISVFGDEDTVLASIEAGALGYLHKDAAPGDIAQTIIDMRAGASPISPMVARRVIAKYRGLRSEGDRALATLEVLRLIARGFSYAEIARLTALSVYTVQTHIKNLYGKLAVHSKNEAVFEATRLGLLRHLD
jgi:DNA-binding NarL/FixJ family response regulator